MVVMQACLPDWVHRSRSDQTAVAPVIRAAPPTLQHQLAAEVLDQSRWVAVLGALCLAVVVVGPYLQLARCPAESLELPPWQVVVGEVGLRGCVCGGCLVDWRMCFHCGHGGF